MTSALFVLLAYLLGSLSFAVVMSRLFGLPDPRTYGSCNPGATNVLRSGKRSAAVLTLVGDTGKGALAVWVTWYFGPPFGVGEATVAAAAVAAFVGHLYPVYFGFKGGKGVATAAGIILMLNLWIGLMVLGVFAAVIAITRIVSLASISAALCTAISAPLILGFRPTAIGLIVMALLVIWRHRSNIARLAAGQESRIGRGNAQPPSERA